MIIEKLRKIIFKAAKAAGYNELVSFDVTEPPREANADFATNIALVIANELKKNPKEVADAIADMIKPDELVMDALVAGPGFININLNAELYRKVIAEIVEQKDDFGKSKIGAGKSVNVEYISANPTGPLHIGNARSGPIGEMIANLFENFGYQVEREFYVNDIGGQVNRLAETIYYWYEKSNGANVELPENCYPGEYMQAASSEIFSENKEKLDGFKNKEDFLEFFKSEGLKKMIKIIKADVGLLGIEFDKWYSERELEENGKAEQSVKELTGGGFTVGKEGALWFKNPEDPELEDRESVLQKSDEAKTLTYFADDIAYHKEKLDRGNALVIDIWGSNHHGHISRLIAAMKALGYGGEQIKIILYQYVRLKNGDDVMKMGKRLGNFVTLRQVIEAGVSPDAFKYFVVSQNFNTPIDFDIKLASERSEKNPVFYIEYAHARICSILKKAGEGMGEDRADLTLLKDETEINLMHELAKYPDILAEIMKDFQIQLLPHYAYKIAGLFHEFYANCVVLTDDKNLTAARLELIKAAKVIIANSLTICDIEAPEKM